MISLSARASGFDVTCDRCKAETFVGPMREPGEIVIPNQAQAEDLLKASGWRCLAFIHYCPDCAALPRCGWCQEPMSKPTDYPGFCSQLCQIEYQNDHQ